MKLVRGVSLHDWLCDPQRPVGSASRLADGLEIMLKVCDAMAFAHSRGVIHRDLKPTNIMVGEFGEVYVMDWGLARVIGTGVSTSSGPEGMLWRANQGAVGTPAYMSPEQAQGRVKDCDERTDVFGLGAVLFELVTGVPPYETSGGAASMEAVRSGNHTPPEEALHGVGVSKRILRIIEKTLARERDDRYQTVAALKADLQRFLRGGLYLPRMGFSPGTRIINEGEKGDSAYIIVRGECVAYKTVDGVRRVLRNMSKGDVFGELAILSDRPRSATVEAIDAVTTLVVDRSTIEDGIGYDSWMGALVKALAGRFREIDAIVNG
jgi:serine/threonine-protein kinase